LVDLVEGERDEASLPHVAQCEQCRQTLSELRRTLTLAAAVDVPEPSPLFWDHFSVRVREAVDNESRRMIDVPRGVRWTRSWRLAISCAAAAIVAVAVSLSLRPSPVVSDDALSTPGSPVPSAALSDGSTAGDAAFAWLADLADATEWDDAALAEMRVRQGSADHVVSDLTSDELAELRRLLEEELARAGAPRS
jgi:hypothetical protein